VNTTLTIRLAPALLFLAASGCHSWVRPPASQPVQEKPAVREEYWPNGKLRLRHEVLVKDDGTTVEHGTYATWFDDGRKEYEGVYVQGRLAGVATRWHRNGVKASEQHYANGLRNGPRFMWDENGLLRKEEHFVDDKPDGVWTTWDDKGRIKARQVYDKGVPKS